MHRLAIGRAVSAVAGVLVVAAAATSAQAAPRPDCVSHVEETGIEVIRVESNGVLVLHDGRAVDLEGIMLPAGRRDHAPGFLAHQAIAALRGMVRHRRATLLLERPKEDRYGRLRAQVYLPREPGRPWLQVALLRQGLARVNIAPDRRECAGELYAAEAQARADRVGIWAYPSYAVRTPQMLQGDTGTFQIVEGRVVAAEIRGGRAYLNFGRDWRTDFTVTIAPDDLKLFRRLGVDPRSYAGKRVRVRGWIEMLNGPQMQIADPEAIQILPPTVTPTPPPDEMRLRPSN